MTHCQLEIQIDFLHNLINCKFDIRKLHSHCEACLQAVAISMTGTHSRYCSLLRVRLPHPDKSGFAITDSEGILCIICVLCGYVRGLINKYTLSHIHVFIIILFINACSSITPQYIAQKNNSIVKNLIIPNTQNNFNSSLIKSELIYYNEPIN